MCDAPQRTCVKTSSRPCVCGLSPQSGEIDVVNNTTGDRCHLKFAPYSYFSRDVARKVSDLSVLRKIKASRFPLEPVVGSSAAALLR